MIIDAFVPKAFSMLKVINFSLFFLDLLYFFQKSFINFLMNSWNCVCIANEEGNLTFAKMFHLQMK